MSKGRAWASSLWEVMYRLRTTALSLAVWAHTASLCPAGVQRTRPPAVCTVRLAGLGQHAVGTVRNQEAVAAQVADPIASWPSRGRDDASTVAGSSRPDPPFVRVHSPFWATSSRLSFGMQMPYAVQALIPPNGSRINLLYAQPQFAISLRTFRASRVERILLVNEGMLGGAINPAGRVLGYTMLFRLEGRTRGNTKPLFDWGGGVVNTTINEHAWELDGHLQFSPQAGIGFEHFFSPQLAFVLEYRFLHLSNAGTVGPNKGVQCSVPTIGFRWLRRPRSLPAPRE